MSTATLEPLEPAILEEIDLIKKVTTDWPQKAKLLLIHNLAENTDNAEAFDVTDEELAMLDKRCEEVSSGKVKPLAREQSNARIVKMLHQ
jgi:hypothetical protein